MDRLQELKVERSIPVQSRVDITVLAELNIYWDSQGYRIKTMSQLLNWSMDLLRQVLLVNKQLPEEVDSVLKAHNNLTVSGLYQSGMFKKAQKKIVRARQLENLRMEGTNPSNGMEGGREYIVSHNSNSINPAPSNTVVDPRLKKAMDIYNADEQARLDRVLEDAKKRKADLEIDENGIVITPSSGYGSYTSKDKNKDDAKKLIKEAEKHVKYNDAPRPLTEEELEEKAKRLKEKDQAEKDAWDSFDPRTLKPSAGQRE